MVPPEYVVVIDRGEAVEYRRHPMLARAMQEAFTARRQGHVASVYRLMQEAEEAR